MEARVPFRDTQLTPHPDVNLSERANVQYRDGEDVEPVQGVTLALDLNRSPK